MSDDMADLIGRLTRARDELLELSARVPADTPEFRRLKAKASGVTLALSYATEYQR